jgi:predicted MPP superfamily phosphohydrolase
VSGLHSWNERWIHITKGIGSVFGVRINCPPELSFLTLT